MIKTLTKIFAFTAVTKSLLETKKSQSAGTTQIHPSKIPGRTVFIREKEYFIRENIIGVVPSLVFSLIKYSFSLINTVLPGILLG